MSIDVSALHRLTVYGELSDTELLHLAGMTRPTRRFAAKAVLAEEGSATPQCFLLLQGWVGSFTTSCHGGRTMTKVYMAGDLIGHTSLAFQEFAETLVTLCPAAIATITNRVLGSLFETHARLASLLYLVAQEERVRQMDWIASLLRLEAAGRIAALFLDLRDRHAEIAECRTQTIPFHLTQYDIADLTGLTSTHTNRIVQRFRRERLIDLSHHELTILHGEVLERLADRPRRRRARDLSWLPAAAR